MDIQHLRAALSVAAHGSLRAAAVALHLTPQSLSEQLARLERGLGATLFARSSTGMRPTPSGERFLGEAAEVVTAFDRLVESTRASAAPAEIRLGAAYDLGDVVRGLVRPLLAERPGLVLRTRQLGCPEHAAALLSGDLHATLAHHPPTRPDPRGVNRLVIDATPRHALFYDRHPLANQPRVTLSRLSREPLILPGTTTQPGCLRELELGEFTSRDLRPRVGAEVHGIDLAIAAVASGAGYALCVRSTYPTGPGLRFVPIADPVLPHEVALLWHDRQAIAPLLAVARRLHRGLKRDGGQEQVASSRTTAGR